MLRTSALCPVKIRLSRPLASSHILILGSEPAEANRFPSRLNDTVFTRGRSLMTIIVSPPDDTSHNFTVLSWLAEASRLPSLLKATLDNQLVWPFKLCSSSPLAQSQIRIV